MIEVQPTEILVHIFKQLPDLKSVKFCFNTCVKWQQIIEELYKDESKILISSGYIGNNLADLSQTMLVEIIDVINPKFNFTMENKKTKSSGAVGCVLEDQAILCGGQNNNEKAGLVFGNSRNTLKLLQKRHQASGVLIDQQTLWITGHRAYGPEAKSTEFFSLHQPPLKGPDLPCNMFAHSMVKVNHNTIYILGGGSGYVHKTWKVDPTNNFKFQDGPLFNEGKIGDFPGCAKMKLNGNIFLVVVGGGSIDENTSVEILDTSKPEKGWKKGPELPKNIFEFTMVSSPTGGVLVIGGSGRKCYYTQSQYKPSGDIFELSGNSIDTLTWKVLDQKLTQPRWHHVAFPITQNAFFNLTKKVKKNSRKRKLEQI